LALPRGRVNSDVRFLFAVRDNHEGMPEILDAFERGVQCFAVVAIERSAVIKQFEFGVSLDGYRALRKMFQIRPFDSMPGAKRRYFFAGRYGNVPGTSEYETAVRVEQDRDGKLVDIRMPKDLLSNLVWFSRIKDFNEASHLVET
jgi:hypothetical protein